MTRKELDDECGVRPARTPVPTFQAAAVPGFSEIPDHLKPPGDLRGRSVLDLACGEGFYTRRIKKAGADRVVGADLSEGMIAVQQEGAEPQGIEYVVSSAETMGAVGPFDVVTAAFLLACVPCASSLADMARSIAANLKPGGRFVTTNSEARGPGVDYRPYGMARDVTGPLPDGAVYHITFLLDADSFTIENYGHSPAAYEEALRGRPDEHQVACALGDRGRAGRVRAGFLARLPDVSPDPLRLSANDPRREK